MCDYCEIVTLSVPKIPCPTKSCWVPQNPAPQKISRSATPSINTLASQKPPISSVRGLYLGRCWHSENLTEFSEPRYWGSYTASYPAGGGGNSGSVAESRASLERAQFANLAPQRRTSAPRRAPAAPRAPAPSPPVVARVVEKRWATILQYFAWTQSWNPNSQPNPKSPELKKGFPSPLQHEACYDEINFGFLQIHIKIVP